jgi:uncharacterized protein (TIGR02271 family)
MLERFKGRVQEGMQVRSADGDKLGKIVACQPTGFMVEKGFLFPKDLLVPYDRITNVGNNEVFISMARADLGEPVPAGTARAGAGGLTEDVKGAARSVKEAFSGGAGEALAAGEGMRREALDEFGKAAEVCVPLVEEEIVTQKRVEKVGEVHVRKEVVTEEKQITIPVTREVVRVERVAVTHDARTGDELFRKESYDFPVSEEHVTIEKRPVVHEELHVGKEIQQGEEIAKATVRRERADVETTGSVRRAEGARGDVGQIRAQAAAGGKR